MSGSLSCSWAFQMLSKCASSFLSAAQTDNSANLFKENPKKNFYPKNQLIWHQVTECMVGSMNVAKTNLPADWLLILKEAMATNHPSFFLLKIYSLRQSTTSTQTGKCKREEMNIKQGKTWLLLQGLNIELIYRHSIKAARSNGKPGHRNNVKKHSEKLPELIDFPLKWPHQPGGLEEIYLSILPLCQ